MKLVCAFLSLPVPSKSKNLCAEEVRHVVERSNSDYLERTLQKLLLIGYSGAGTSTLFKQVVAYHIFTLYPTLKCSIVYM